MLVIPNSAATKPKWLDRLTRNECPNTFYTNLAPLWESLAAAQSRIGDISEMYEDSPFINGLQDWVFLGVTDTKLLAGFNNAVLGVLQDFKDVDAILVCGETPPKMLFGEPGIRRGTETAFKFHEGCAFGDVTEILEDMPDDSEWCWSTVDYLQCAMRTIEECDHTFYNVDVNGTPIKILALSPAPHASYSSAQELHDLLVGESAAVELDAEGYERCIYHLVVHDETMQLTRIKDVRLYIAEDAQLMLEARCRVNAKNTPLPLYADIDGNPPIRVTLITQYATFAKHMGLRVNTPTKEVEDVLAAGLEVNFLENEEYNAVKVWYIKDGSPQGTPPLRMTLVAKYKSD